MTRSPLLSTAPLQSVNKQCIYVAGLCAPHTRRIATWTTIDRRPRSVIAGRSGDIQSRLPKRCAGGSSDTPGPGYRPPVGAKRSCTVDLQTSTLRSHFRCTCQLAPAARLGTRRLQDRRADVHCQLWISLTSFTNLENTTADVSNWISSNFLSLNPSKTEFLIFGVAYHNNSLNSIILPYI